MADIVSLVAIAAMVGAMTDGGGTSQPVRLDVQSDGTVNVVRVIAEGGTACTASYELTVSGSDGGDRSVNRGTIKVPGNGPIAVATAKVGRSGDSGITATLDVTPCDGKPYRQVWTSGANVARR